MVLQSNLSEKLYGMFKRSFKPELVYFNNSGVLHWMLETWFEHTPSMSKITTSDLYLDDFDRYRGSTAVTNVTFSCMTGYDIKRLQKVMKMLEGMIPEHSGDEMGALFKVYPATAINYIMMHLLIDNGFLESKCAEMLVQDEEVPNMAEMDPERIVLE